MPSPSARRLAFGLDLGPSGTYSCVTHLAPLSAGFGASCTGVSLRSLSLYCMYYRYISGSALWECPPSPVASKVIRPVGGCALPNFERPSPAPY
jgi:hypothetical protein